MLRLGLPGCIMTWSEWFGWEANLFLAGTLCASDAAADGGGGLSGTGPDSWWAGLVPQHTAYDAEVAQETGDPKDAPAPE